MWTQEVMSGWVYFASMDMTCWCDIVTCGRNMWMCVCVWGGGWCKPSLINTPCCYCHPCHPCCVQASSSISRTITVVCPAAKPFLCSGLCRALDCNIPDIAAAQPVVPNTPPKLRLLLPTPPDAALLPTDAGANLTYYLPFGVPVASSQGGGYNFDVCPPSPGNVVPSNCAAFTTDKVLLPLLHASTNVLQFL